MSEETKVPDLYYPALEYLASVGMIFAHDVKQTDIPYWNFVWLKDHGLAIIETPDPNFLYQIPEERWNEYQFKITSKGMTTFLLLKEARDQREKQEEEQRAKDIKAVQDKKESRRHDFKVAAFGGLIALISENFGDLIDLANRFVDVLLALLN